LRKTLKLANGIEKEFASVLQMSVVLVAGTRPEEAAESVAFGTGDDVDVKVGNALADLVVERDEGALGSQGRLEGEGEQSGVPEEGGGEFVREFGQTGDMAAGNEKDMAGEKRAVVEEGEGVGVFKNYSRGRVPGGDLAELAGRHGRSSLR
jgi:hypothetical protein